MHIIKYKNVGGADSEESNLFRTTANISSGKVTISRVMYFESDKSIEDAVDITALPEFPAVSSAHPLHPQFKYYGDATIEPLSAQSKIWRATLEYSTTLDNANAKDKNGKDVTEDTPPWLLRPDNISFSYPEVTVPFKVAYDSKGKLTVPVVNTAGNILTATKSIFNAQMSFTFATKSWSPENGLKYGNTINAKSEKICGIKFPANTVMLLPPEATFVTVYQDGTTQIKWEYWNVTINLLIDISETVFARKLLNVGDRAKFRSLSLTGDELLSKAGVNGFVPATDVASQICSFRLTKESSLGNGKSDFIPTGDLVFCSWEQYIAARKLYLDASTKLKDKISTTYQLQCEQHQSMPLNKSGYLLEEAIQGHKKYNSNAEYLQLSFNQYAPKSWNSLDLPSQGVK